MAGMPRTLLEAESLDTINEAYYAALLENWADPYLNAVEESLGGMTDEKKVHLAVMLENTRNAICAATGHRGRSIQGLFEATQASDVGPFIQFAFDLITAVMPNLISERIVSVQPMRSSIGQAFYLEYLYGSSKGGVTAGESMLSPLTGTSANPAHLEYSSNTVSDEPLADAGSTGIDVTLAWLPLIPGTLRLTDGTTVWADNGQGAVAPLPSGQSIGTIDYSSGRLQVTIGGEGAQGAVYVSYTYNNQYAPAAVPEVNVRLNRLPLTAVSRKLRALYSFDASYNIRMEQGVDIDSALLEATSAEILHEIDGEILNDLRTMAGGTATWDRKLPEGMWWSDYKTNFVDHLSFLSNAIFQKTRRAEGNVLVVGTSVAAIIESYPSTMWSNVATGKKSGPYFMGVLQGKWDVYKNPFYGANEYLVGYKGDTMLDTGYIYAPYLPIFATQLLMRDDFTARRGFASSYAKRMVNPNMFIKGSVIDSTENPSASNEVFGTLV